MQILQHVEDRFGVHSQQINEGVNAVFQSCNLVLGKLTCIDGVGAGLLLVGGRRDQRAVRGVAHGLQSCHLVIYFFDFLFQGLCRFQIVFVQRGHHVCLQLILLLGQLIQNISTRRKFHLSLEIGKEIHVVFNASFGTGAEGILLHSAVPALGQREALVQIGRADLVSGALGAGSDQKLQLAAQALQLSAVCAELAAQYRIRLTGTHQCLVFAADAPAKGSGIPRCDPG